MGVLIQLFVRVVPWLAILLAADAVLASEQSPFVSRIAPYADATSELDNLNTLGFGPGSICVWYSDRAVKQQQLNRSAGCAFAGPEWSDNTDYHKNWCLDGNDRRVGPGDSYRVQKLQACLKSKGAKSIPESQGSTLASEVDSDCYTGGAVGTSFRNIGYPEFLRWRDAYYAGDKKVKYSEFELTVPSYGFKYRQLCAGPYLVKGLGCEGRYCTNFGAKCCRFTRDYGTSIMAAERSFTSNSWSQWFSEERPNNEVTSRNGFVQDLDCRGDNCDQMSLRIVTHPSVINTGVCRWSRDFSEESTKKSLPIAESCGPSEFVAGMRCIGPYCDNIQIYCCKAELK